MLTYDLSKNKGSLYESLYKFIKEDISNDKLSGNYKMPSKRALAKNLGISTITVEKAYDQLISEGYLYAVPKVGYFVSDIYRLKQGKTIAKPIKNLEFTDKTQDSLFDFSSNVTETRNFPFSIWAKMIRETISNKEKDLMNVPPHGGVRELREAISSHLMSFRGMEVNPSQIIVGAGTEYLYGLIVKLLGKSKRYSIENPGYIKLLKIYKINDVFCELINLDKQGIMVGELKKSKANVVHISPNHHFPTGITMPVSRRYELLAWANEKNGRYIIEDDYDSEFRLNGKPIPTLQSLDASEKVIYMNTFSKSLASTIRISYMILPPHLAKLFYEKLSFYSCTVSTFEQYALAAFIRQGYFEKHINRMRLYYGRKRAKILELIKKELPQKCHVIENDSGLHFLLELKTNFSDSTIKKKLLMSKIKISAVTDYNMKPQKSHKHLFILNYSNIDLEGFNSALKEIKKILFQ